MALQGAALVEDMCLPRLETLELFSFANDGGGPSFQLGSPLAHQQGARGVCTEIGSLVAVGALPSLKQVERTQPSLRTCCVGIPARTPNM